MTTRRNRTWFIASALFVLACGDADNAGTAGTRNAGGASSGGASSGGASGNGATGGGATGGSGGTGSGGTNTGGATGGGTGGAGGSGAAGGSGGGAGGTGGSGATGGSGGTSGAGGSGTGGSGGVGGSAMPDGSAGGTSKDAGSNPDVGGPSSDASRDAITPRDSSMDATGEGANGDDGPPNRKPCTTSFGSGLSQAFGRIDGYLSAVIIPNQATCKPDNDHVYLQISMNNATYQIAVNVFSNQGDGGLESQVLYLEKGLTTLPDGAWQEGWHTGGSVTFDYVSTAGVHAADFTATPLNTLAKAISDRLVNVNHISVFGTGYGPDGADLIHRNGSSHDGAIVTEPLSATPHVLMFHFSNQSF